LDIKGPNLVKGIRFEGLRVLGKPADFARFYYENGADELIYIDAVASLYGRNSLNEFVESTSKEIFVPLTVGGGLRTLEDIRIVLRSGADKVAINTAAIKSPQLIREASRAFGSSTIVVSIEAMQRQNGTYEAYVFYGRESTGVDVFEWALRAVELGAGELLVTSINRDGTRGGFDLELTKKIAESVRVPVIACGGAGSYSHVLDVINKGKADAVSLASALHYHHASELKYGDESFSTEGNIEFLKGRAVEEYSSVFEEFTISNLKRYLQSHGIQCRQQDIGMT
jgi:cyclase